MNKYDKFICSVKFMRNVLNKSEKFMRNMFNVILWNLLALFFFVLVVSNTEHREIPEELVLGISIYLACIFINAERMVSIDEDDKKSLIKEINKALAKVSTLYVTFDNLS